MKDSLGNRMKSYENVTRLRLTPRSCVIIRIDGKAFHTFTKNMRRPFDDTLVRIMAETTHVVGQQMQGFKLAYTQSDESSFLITDFDNIESQGWFDYNLSKIISISASLFTGHFNRLSQIIPMQSWKEKIGSMSAFFDSRAFVVPQSDIANYFLWRMKDWERNSLQMYARAWFSSKELHKKNKADIHEMLHQIGRNWAEDLPGELKNGIFILNKNKDQLAETDPRFITDMKPNFEEINELIQSLLVSKKEGDI